MFADGATPHEGEVRKYSEAEQQQIVRNIITLLNEGKGDAYLLCRHLGKKSAAFLSDVLHGGEQLSGHIVDEIAAVLNVPIDTLLTTVAGSSDKERLQQRIRFWKGFIKKSDWKPPEIKLKPEGKVTVTPAQWTRAEREVLKITRLPDNEVRNLETILRSLGFDMDAIAMAWPKVDWDTDKAKELFETGQLNGEDLMFFCRLVNLFPGAVQERVHLNYAKIKKRSGGTRAVKTKEAWRGVPFFLCNKGRGKDGKPFADLYRRGSVQAHFPPLYTPLSIHELQQIEEGKQPATLAHVRVLLAAATAAGVKPAELEGLEAINNCYPHDVKTVEDIFAPDEQTKGEDVPLPDTFDGTLGGALRLLQIKTANVVPAGVTEAMLANTEAVPLEILKKIVASAAGLMGISENQQAALAVIRAEIATREEGGEGMNSHPYVQAFISLRMGAHVQTLHTGLGDGFRNWCKIDVEHDGIGLDPADMAELVDGEYGLTATEVEKLLQKLIDIGFANKNQAVIKAFTALRDFHRKHKDLVETDAQAQPRAKTPTLPRLFTKGDEDIGRRFVRVIRFYRSERGYFAKQHGLTDSVLDQIEAGSQPVQKAVFDELVQRVSERLGANPNNVAPRAWRSVKELADKYPATTE